MNKRMRKLILSLGLVVVLGTGNAFADTSVESQLAVYIKSAMDAADDYAVFGNNVTTGTAHFDGTIAAVNATLQTKIGASSFVKGNHTSYIGTLNEASINDELFIANNNLATNTDKHNIVEEGGTYYWIESDGVTRVKMAASKYVEDTNESGLRIFSITNAGLGTTEKPITISSALTNLKNLSTNLVSKKGDGAVNIVNVDASALVKGTGNEGETFNVALPAPDGENKTGITVVNVKVTDSDLVDTKDINQSDVRAFIASRKLTINGAEINNNTDGSYNTDAGKVIFNFVNSDGTPFAGNLIFGMGAGVILAPSAVVELSSSYGSGNFNGSVLCDTFTGSAGEMHQVEFNLIDKYYIDDEEEEGNEGGGFKDFDNNEETGDVLRYGAMAVVGLAASGLFLVNRKDEDEE